MLYASAYPLYLAVLHGEVAASTRCDTEVAVCKAKIVYGNIGIAHVAYYRFSLCHLDITVEKGGVIVADKTGMEFMIESDSVILSAGYKPMPLAEKAKHIHIVGDADKVGNLRTVIWGAWDVCMKL